MDGDEGAAVLDAANVYFNISYCDRLVLAHAVDEDAYLFMVWWEGSVA